MVITTAQLLSTKPLGLDQILLNVCQAFAMLRTPGNSADCQKQPFADVLLNRCLTNFAIFTGKPLAWPATLLKRDSNIDVFL